MRQVRWLLFLAAAWVVLAARGAGAFALIDLQPATFPPQDAGLVMTFTTAQETADYSFWVMFPKREPPQLPLPIVPMIFQFTPPAAEDAGPQPSYKRISSVEGTLEVDGEVGAWTGRSSGMIVRSPGETHIWVRFKAADLERFKRLGVERISVLATAVYQLNVRVLERKLRIADILTAAPRTPPPLQPPQPAKPVAKDKPKT